MPRPVVVMSVAALWSCAAPEPEEAQPVDDPGGFDGTDSADGADGTDGTDGTDPEPCSDTSAASLPDGLAWDDVTWLELDGSSDVLYDFAAPSLSSAWEGSYGTYDLNTVAMESANGFKLERPGRVVAARAQWTHLEQDENPATMYVWPDFGSDGYMWDAEHPAATVTRCLGPGADAEWTDHVLSEAIVVPQPLQHPPLPLHLGKLALRLLRRGRLHGKKAVMD